MARISTIELLIRILYTIIKRTMWILFSCIKYTYLTLFNGKTMLDHYIFYSPAPNPWFKPDN